jgi:hypothetical protein
MPSLLVFILMVPSPCLHASMPSVDVLVMSACRAGAALASLYAEELGLVLEVAEGEAQAVAARYSKAGVPARVIGKVCSRQEPIFSTHKVVGELHHHTIVVTTTGIQT